MRRALVWNAELKRLEYRDQTGWHRVDPTAPGGGGALSGVDPIVVAGSQVKFEPASDVDFNEQEATNFVIENRTSDPGSPAEGRIWLRTDL